VDGLKGRCGAPVLVVGVNRLAELDCIFCKIGGGEIPSERVFDDGVAFAIRDIAPKAPVHLLVIPFAHVEALESTTDGGQLASAHCLEVAPGIATSAGLESYRLVVNQGADAGQEVSHFHLHILGGRRLGAMG
jgi:histidine triad (HIT) family protein